MNATTLINTVNTTLAAASLSFAFLTCVAPEALATPKHAGQSSYNTNSLSNSESSSNSAAASTSSSVSGSSVDANIKNTTQVENTVVNHNNSSANGGTSTVNTATSSTGGSATAVGGSSYAGGSSSSALGTVSVNSSPTVSIRENSPFPSLQPAPLANYSFNGVTCPSASVYGNLYGRETQEYGGEVGAVVGFTAPFSSRDSQTCSKLAELKERKAALELRLLETQVKEYERTFRRHF